MEVEPVVLGPGEIQEIRPGIPDKTLQGLLALTSAQVLPLNQGELVNGSCNKYAILAAARGGLSATTHSQCVMLRQGQVLVLRNPGVYTIQAMNECLGMVIQLQGDLVDRLLLDKLTDGATVLSHCAPAVRETVLALQVLEEEQSEVSGLSATGYAFSLLLKLHSVSPQDTETASAYSPLVDSAIAIIQEEFPYLENLDELSARLEVTKPHLIRTFTKTVGISPGKYITRVRIDYAKLLLKSQDVSIAYVAEAAGFSGANYFAKVFRRETGMSPSEYTESTLKSHTPQLLRGSGPAVW
jgi:AraC-like DNA-binding protein